jgi:hypothetical protein
MALYDRLLGGAENKISVHVFTALVAEAQRGHVTGAQARAALGLTVDEAQEAQTLITRLQASGVTRQEVHDVLMLAEQGKIYITPADIKARFGV